MSHYNDNPKMCRVDIFKPSGKWIETRSIEFIHYYGCIFKAFNLSIDEADIGYLGMNAVCLEPYHSNSHPIQITIGE